MKPQFFAPLREFDRLSIFAVAVLAAGALIAAGCGAGSAGGAKFPARSAHVETAPSAQAHDADPEWQAVVTAHSGPDQALAIVQYDNYRQQNPDKHAAELANFQRDALEFLWWRWVLDLFNDRAELDKVIQEKKTDLADQPPGEFRKHLESELADLQQKRHNVNQTLTVDMGYTLSIPPDVDDPDAIARLDAKRDPLKFENWEKETLSWIREHNGRPPWADE